MDKRQKTDSRKERSRKAIIQAANVAFSDFGFEATSMDEIAKRAGLSRQTVYNFFSDKDEIAHAIGYQMAMLVMPHFQAEMAANRSAKSLLKEAFFGSAQWCLDNPEIAAITLAGPKQKRIAPPDEQASFHALIRDIFELGQKQNLIRKDHDANILALVLLGSYAQYMLFALGGGPFDFTDLDTILRINFEGCANTHETKVEKDA